MRGYATLAARIQRVEKRRGGKRRLPTLLMAIHSEFGPGEIVGIQASGGMIERRPDEPLRTLTARVRALTGNRIAIAAYAAVGPLSVPTAAPAVDPVPATPPATFDPKQPDAWRDWRAFAEEGLKS